ncbi:stationary phase survival protein SurE [Rubrolithibacter danxiaensis]|uniref:stationary phase survival protein SurE n=1 Tax=Rubrolithibacter danxiaensis TaxID=3390805 RepID=UPI003BF8FD06
MLKRDNVWYGLILGLIFPGIAFFIVEVLKKNIRVLQKDDLLYIGCIALNLLLLRFFVRGYKEKTAKGIVASTFVCAFIFFYYKMHK